MTVNALREALRHALAFLADAQKADGGFRLAFSSSQSLQRASDVASPFAAAIVLLALDGVAGVSPQLRARAIAHLISKREKNGLIRFCDFPIEPDYDDICLIHSLLQDANVALDYRRIARRVASARGDDDLFPTWVGSGSPRDVDPIVNVNIVRFLDRNGIDCTTTVARLRTIVAQKWNAREGTRYYTPPASLPWMISTLPTRLRAQLADGDHSALCAKLATTPPLSPLDRAMRVICLNRLGGAERPPIALLAPLLDAQQRDGGWPADAFFCGDRFWGSRELTTAVAVSALSSCDGE